MKDAHAAVGGPQQTLPRLSRGVRDAVRFVHAHAEERITVPDIATAARLSARGLQTAFRRELNTTPGQYLRSVRLDGVRRDLQENYTDSSTIAEVARRWHFSNAGRMAAEYRTLFGSAPSAAVRFFDADDASEQTSVTAPRDVGRRFRVVLDCEVDIEDAGATLLSALERAARDRGSWQGYQPDGGTEDLVAYVLGRAVRAAAEDTDGVRLLAVDPMLRIADTRGGYPVAELPAMWPAEAAHPGSVLPSREEAGGRS